MFYNLGIRYGTKGSGMEPTGISSTLPQTSYTNNSLYGFTLYVNGLRVTLALCDENEKFPAHPHIPNLLY